MTTEYLLGASAGERERLMFQAELFRPEAEGLLDHCGVEPGWRAIDVGCGPLGIMDLLSQRVGPGGTVVGLDNEPHMIEMARATVAERGLRNVELTTADAASSGLPHGSFDFAHTRMVLMNVPHPDRVLGEMIDLVRPGGVVAVQDVDWISRVCVPENPAWNRLVAAIAELWRRNGMDVYLGRRLPLLLRDAGLTDVGVDASLRVFRHGEPYHRLVLARAELCRDELVGAGLLTEQQFERDTDELRRHLDDPRTTVLHATLFQAWGRVPR